MRTAKNLKSNTFFVGGTEATEIYTSCSQPLEAGFVYGSFEVLSVSKIARNGQSAGLAASGSVTGTTVDLIDGQHNILSALTDENGNYVF